MLVSSYNVVWGQCSNLLQNKLKANQQYEKSNNTSDVVTLLSNKIEENTSVYDALHEAKSKFYKYQQSDNKTLADHMRNFKDLCNSIEYHGGDTFFDKDMKEREIRTDIKNKISDTTSNKYGIRVTGKAKAVAFIKSANIKIYGKLLMSIRKQHSFKIDIYPKTLADVYKMLSAHTTHNNNNYQSKQRKDKRTTSANTNDNNNEETTNNTTNTSNTDTGTLYLQTN